MNTYVTNNFDIGYPIVKISKISIEIELLRKYFYELILESFSSIDIGLSKKKLKEIFFYFVVANCESDIDPIIHNKYNFDIKIIQNILINNKINNFVKIKDKLKQVKKELIKYTIEFNKMKKKCKRCFDVVITEKNDLIILTLKKICDDDFYLDVTNLSFSIHISLYKHLQKLYMVRNKVDIISNDFYDKIFIIYCRYNYLSSGSTQASIQPQFKKTLMELINTKVELFASAINSSYVNYGSLFYDIERYFGSFGSYFKMDIKAGYFEANPPFEKTIIYKMFAKMDKELKRAEKNKRPLLFFIIIPKMELSDIPGYSNQFLKFSKLVDDLKYMYYDESFSYAITRNIIYSYVILYYTSYVKEAVKKNSNFIFT